ncbi:MAG: site-specific integrase, partial [Hyphomicrobiaceae bacterium]|nr:site-specific integrase [Hyphomicrobiaceae bacterium]
MPVDPQDELSAFHLAPELSESAHAWLDHLRYERGAADLTIAAYERDLRQFATYLHRTLRRPPTVVDLATVDVKTFRGFLAARRREGSGSRSLARTMSGLRSFYEWLESSGRLINRKI